jgi:PAS domain S-box-containing protein
LLSLLVAAAGVLAMMLLAWLTHALARRGRAARQREARAVHAWEDDSAMLQACMALSADGFIVTDAQGVVMRASGRAGQLFGAGPQHLARRSLDTLVPGATGVVPGDAAGSAAHRELTGMRTDGSRFALRVSAARLPAADSGTAHWLWAVTDLEPERRAQQAAAVQAARYASEMTEASLARLTIEGLLRRALAGNEFRLRYQPIIDTATLAIPGVEALIAWDTSERGPMHPAEFIPIAEQSGLVIPLGEWILATACREIQALRQDLGRNIEVAVNISPLQLRQASFPDTVARCLQQAGLPPQALVIEVTEGILVDGGNTTIETFRRLRELGVGLSIDDFGTGYSGLSYLTRLPISRLKIDKSFVDGVAAPGHDQAVAAAIIALGHQLHLKVIAEGVETAEQFEFLRAHGCDGLQGFLFSHALPQQALRALLEKGVEVPLPAPAGTPERRES